MIVVARTVHFASVMLLFGGLLFALAVATPVSRGRMPLLAIGTQGQLLPEYDFRLFWIRTSRQRLGSPSRLPS